MAKSALANALTSLAKEPGVEEVRAAASESAGDATMEIAIEDGDALASAAVSTTILAGADIPVVPSASPSASTGASGKVTSSSSSKPADVAPTPMQSMKSQGSSDAQRQGYVGCEPPDEMTGTWKDQLVKFQDVPKTLGDIIVIAKQQVYRLQLQLKCHRYANSDPHLNRYFIF